MRNRYVLHALLTLMLALVSAHAIGQPWPSKPVRVLVGFAPGTGVDTATRIVAEGLSKRLGQPFVVENRSGASGTIAAALAARAPADGYTLLGASTSLTSVSAITKDLPFDLRKDLAGVTTISAYSFVLVAAPSKGWKSLQQMIAAAKASPQPITFASSGFGTTPHFATEKFRLAAGFEALHVPFKSVTEALTEVMSGRIDILLIPPSGGLPFIRDGKLVPLAMTSSQYSPIPNVPSMQDLGIANEGCCSVWTGLLVPSKTPGAIVNRLHEEVVKVLEMPEYKERLLRTGGTLRTMMPEEFDALIQKEISLFDEISKALNTQLR